MANEFWTIKEAAEAWGVSYCTARRYAKRLRGDSRCRIRKGTPPPKVRRGNPNFRDSAKQAEYSRARWAGQMTSYERLCTEIFLEECEMDRVERLRQQIRAYLPPPDPEALEAWEPYPMPEYDEYPSSPL